MATKKSAPRYEREYENGGKRNTEDALYGKRISSNKDEALGGAFKYTGKNTYKGPDKPSEGRSDKASDRPPMSKKWVEKK